MDTFFDLKIQQFKKNIEEIRQEMQDIQIVFIINY